MATARKSRVLRIITLMLIIMLFCPIAHSTIIHVNNNGQADFDTIQAGIDAAVDRDTVLVAPGEYVITEPITFRGKAITVKSAAGSDETTIRMGTPADTNRGSVVVFENNETSESVLDGVTITGGRGFWFPSVNAFGAGGILFNASSGTVRDCAIVQNTAKHGGGVGCVQTCSPTLIDCVIAENSAGDSGGGVFLWSGPSLIMTDCIISGNSAGGAGGGLVRGGGQNTSMTMTRCTIMDNTAQQEGGGGMDLADGFGTLTNCVIARNTARRWSGGLLCVYPNSSTIVINCTIWGNSAGEDGGGMGCYIGSSVEVKNSIVQGNTSFKGREISVQDPASTLTIAYSNVAGGQAAAAIGGGGTLNWGEGNIDVDPCFADPNLEDYHLKSETGRWDPNSQSWVQDDVTSPCIDVGDPNSDWTGEIWPHGERINMGAFGGTLEASMSTKLESMSLPRVAYVYGSDVEATESYRSLLMSYGCPTTLMGVDDVTTAALDSYDLIIVANDTQYETTWSDPNTVAAIEDSGRPVVGLGDGGYDFFGLLGLSIGNPYGGHGSKHSIEVIEPNGSVFNTPYSIEIPQDHVLQLYTETHHVGIYLWPTIPETVTVLGREVDDVGYHSLVVEQDRYLLWGFTESPLKMTEEGKRLFINVVIRASNKALSS